MSSVDDLGSDYVVGSDPTTAVETLVATLPAPNRVSVERLDDKTVEATTKYYTPAWAFAGLVIPPIGLLMLGFIRKTRTARLTVQSTSAGTVISTRGSLDTAAANRLRALRV